MNDKVEHDTNETESREMDTSKLANLTPEEIVTLAKLLAKDMLELAPVTLATKDVVCVICGSKLASFTALVGGYNTILCQDDRNRWHEYVETAPAMSSLESAELRLKIAVFKGEETSALGFHAGVKQSKKELYELAKKWVEFNGQ
jgi:hypothetical protein